MSETLGLVIVIGILVVVLSLCLFVILTLTNATLDVRAKIRRNVKAGIGALLIGGAVLTAGLPQNLRLPWALLIAGGAGWMLLVGRGGHIMVERKGASPRKDSETPDDSHP